MLIVFPFFYEQMTTSQCGRQIVTQFYAIWSNLTHGGPVTAYELVKECVSNRITSFLH